MGMSRLPGGRECVVWGFLIVAALSAISLAQLMNKETNFHNLYLERDQILGRLPVEGVDFLAADVADDQRSIVRRQPCPRTERTPKPTHSL